MARGHDISRRTALGGLALAGLGSPLLSACLGEGQKLSLAIWRDYLGETTLKDFYRATGISVTATTYADNAELYARVKQGNHGYDLVVPSSHWVERMVREGLLAPLSHRRLPNLANLEAPFANLPYDPGNAHSVPYTWLAMGIGYRKSKVPRPPAGWKELLAAPERFGRVALPDDPAVLFRLAAKALGFSANLFNPERLKKAEALLAAALPRSKALHRDGGQDLLLGGKADLAVLWNGDLVQVALEDPDIAFAVPVEGALLMCDCLCIPAGASHPGNAHMLIDYLLDASAGAAVAGHIWFPTPNEAARRLLPPEYRGNPVLYPPHSKGVSEFLGDNPGLDTQFSAAMKRLQVPQ